MYPAGELRQLAALKVGLQREIALERTRCTEAAMQVAQPLEWLDRLLALWGRLSPLAQFAVVPLALLARRMVFRRLKFLRSLAYWGPLIFGAGRAIKSAIKTRNGFSRSSPRTSSERR
jgi:hypothetical protein